MKVCTYWMESSDFGDPPVAPHEAGLSFSVKFHDNYHGLPYFWSLNSLYSSISGQKCEICPTLMMKYLKKE